jgi:ribose/xylose/arabinose/galactoside ABC-type transport system permease subunit
MRRSIVETAGSFLGLVVVCFVFGIAVGPQFFSGANLDLIARQTAIVGTAAVGMTVVIVSAGIDLSVGSMIALATVTIALLLRAGVSPSMAALAALAVGALAGIVNGVLIVALRVAPFIVTLGTMLVVRGAAKGLAADQRIEAPMSWLNELLRTPGRDSLMIAPWGIWLLAALAIFVALVLQYTRFGRHVFAIGSNERMARLCGVAVERTKVFVYIIGAALAGLAGVMQFAKLAVGDPTVAIGLELDVIAAVIIGGGSLSGGKGTVLGTLIGATIMTIIQIGCSQLGLPNWVQQIVTGGIIVIAVALDRWRTEEIR